MKQTILTIAFAVLPIALTAQTPDTLTIGEAQYRITYQAKAVKDTTRVPYVYHDDEMRLDIAANGLSKFYSRSKELRDSVLRLQIQLGAGIDFRKAPKAGMLAWTLYRNYPEQGKTLMLDQMMMTSCQMEEEMEVPEWTLVPDSVKEILGYTCQLATTQFKGRKWSAWYTEDIPLDCGPWKLCGLPGLILSAYDSQRQFIFEGAGLEQVSAPITFIKSQREKMSMKDFRKLQNSYDPNDAIRQHIAGGGEVIVRDANGNKIERLKKPKFNNIER